MEIEIFNPIEFADNGMFLEKQFFERAKNYDWSKFALQNVLIRGCDSKRIPTWVYMYVTAQLMPIVKSMRFGSEHDSVLIYKKR